MAGELDVELEQYEKVVGNLNFSTPVGSRSAYGTSEYGEMPTTEQMMYET